MSREAEAEASSGGDPTIKHIEVTLSDENIQAGFLKVLGSCRPNWPKDEIEFKFSPKTAERGLINTMFKCFLSSEKAKALVGRVYNEKYDVLMNRSTEVAFIKLVHDLYGFAPKIVATFTNGFCYEYVHGEIMSSETVAIECNWRIIAKQIALLHSTEIDRSLQSKGRFGELVTTVPEDYPISLKDAGYNERFRLEFPQKGRVIPEITKLIERVLSLESPIVFCHNDLRPENMLWNRETGKITFVDFETSGFNYQAQEIAFHFWRYVRIDKNDFSMYPQKCFQIEWLRCYLRHWFEFTDRNPDTVTDQHIDRLYVQVNNFYLLLMYQMLGKLSLVDELTEIGINVDLFDMALANYKEYLNRRDEILSLELPEIPADKGSFTGWYLSDFDDDDDDMYAQRRTTI